MRVTSFPWGVDFRYANRRQAGDHGLNISSGVFR